MGAFFVLSVEAVMSTKRWRIEALEGRVAALEEECETSGGDPCCLDQLGEARVNLYEAQRTLSDPYGGNHRLPFMDRLTILAANRQPSKKTPPLRRIN